jgi:type II secretory pathway pseudopilin PulG
MGIAVRGRCARKQSRAGFTLLEVLFATGVLFVTLMAAVAGQLSAVQLSRTAREQTTACAELSAAMEEILAEPFDSIPLAGGFPEAQAIATYTNRRLSNELIVPDYANYAGGALPDVLQIALLMTYTDWAGRPAQMRLVTLRAR